jgi:hypothetical protein
VVAELAVALVVDRGGGGGAELLVVAVVVREAAVPSSPRWRWSSWSPSSSWSRCRRQLA